MPVGELNPAEIHVPGVYIKSIVKANVEKKIERLTVTQPASEEAGETKAPSQAAQMRERIVRRAALELKDGMNVNLGIGMPTLASNYLPDGNRLVCCLPGQQELLLTRLWFCACAWQV